MTNNDKIRKSLFDSYIRAHKEIEWLGKDDVLDEHILGPDFSIIITPCGRRGKFNAILCLFEPIHSMKIMSAHVMALMKRDLGWI